MNAWKRYASPCVCLFHNILSLCFTVDGRVLMVSPKKKMCYEKKPKPFSQNWAAFNSQDGLENCVSWTDWLDSLSRMHGENFREVVTFTVLNNRWPFFSINHSMHDLSDHLCSSSASLHFPPSLHLSSIPSSTLIPPPTLFFHQHHHLLLYSFPPPLPPLYWVSHWHPLVPITFFSRPPFLTANHSSGHCQREKGWEYDRRCGKVSRKTQRWGKEKVEMECKKRDTELKWKWEREI